MSSVAGSLCEICDAIAGKFGLNPDEVLRVAAGQIGQVGVLNGQIGAGGQVGGRLNSLVPSSKVLRKEISEASSQVEDDDEDRTGRPLNLMNKDDAGNSSSYPELCSVTDVVELPRGKNLQDMTLEDLQKTIQAQKKRSVTEEDTKAIPFLLRFCLGEFQYGQGTVAGSVQSNQNSLTSNHRQKKPILSGTTFGDNLSASSGTPPATFTPQQRAAAGLTTVLGVGSISNKLSIQQPPEADAASVASTSASTSLHALPPQQSKLVKNNSYDQLDSVSENGDGSTASTDEVMHASAVSAAFDALAREAKFRHLHQMSGWVDLTDKQIWDDYVRDTVNGKVLPGDRVFEAGCGVLAFLRSLQETMPLESRKLTLGGVDGAPKTVELVRNELAAPEDKDNFYVGLVPDCLQSVPDNSWDVVVCNSVFQYINDKELAKKAVEQMIRIAKRWVIIADVLDAKYHDVSNARIKHLGWTKDVPEYRSYDKVWWEENFDAGENLVSIRHVECQYYARRKERYVVYIEKNAPITDASAVMSRAGKGT